MGDGASPAFVVGDVVLATHDVFVFGETYSAEVIDTRMRDGVAEFKVLRSGSNEKDATWLAVNKMVRDTVDARREAGMLDEPVNEPEGAQEPAKAAKAAKKPKAKPAAKANASEGPDAKKKASAESAATAAEASKKKRSEAEPAAAGSAKRAKTADAEREPEPDGLSAKKQAPKREPEGGAAKGPAAKKKKPAKKKKLAAASFDAAPATPPAAANGEGANVANVRSDPSEQEEAEIRVELSASLKRELITQWERVTLQGELLSLPRSVTAAEVLRRFEADAKKKARSAEQAALAAACAAGLKAYFDGALYSSLLYAEERAQAEAALVSHKNTKKREPSEVYGAEHLLRLFVKLPELVPLRDMDAAAAKAVQAKLTEFVRWMQRNASAHFVSGEYVDARPAAAAKAGEATVAT